MTTLRDTNLSQSLDLTGKTLLLPLETDAVLHYANRAAFPATGRLKRIYIADDTGLTWSWTGTTYQPSAPSTDEFATLEGTVTQAEEDIAALQLGLANTSGDLSALPTLLDAVQNILEFPTAASFPPVGRAQRLYIALDSGLPYRWDGTAYTPAADLPPTFSPTPPAHPYQGQRWTDTFDLTTYEWFVSAWVEKPNNQQ
jgi:hypothetical protein